jgi:hypothetical protein
VPLKHICSLHGITSQKTAIFVKVYLLLSSAVNRIEIVLLNKLRNTHMVENLYFSHICKKMNKFLKAKFLRMYVLCQTYCHVYQ